MIATALLLILAQAVPPSGFLAEEAPRRLRLVSDESDAPPPHLGWTRRQLKAEYDRLDSIRPGLGLPIGLMAGGGGALLFGAEFFVSALTAGGILGGTADVVLLVVCGVVAIVGAGLLILGGIFLARILPERRAIGRQMDELDQELNSPSDAPPPAREGPDFEPMTPPPLPPPQVMLSPLPITLARF